MKSYSEDDLRKKNWGGLRKTLKAPLFNPTINSLVVAGLKLTPSSPSRSRVPVMKNSADFRLSDGQTVKMHEPHRCSVARNLFWNDGVLPDAADHHAIRMAEAMARDADIFLDIGAYTGQFALMAAQANPDLHAHAFEILPATYLLLQKNIMANNLHQRITPHLVALGAEEGSLRLPFDTELSGLPTSLSLAWEFTDGVDVPCAPLDSIDLGKGERIAIKIDVEGFEGAVLEGAKEMLARAKPDMVCEVLMSSEAMEQTEAVLRPLGYNFWQFTDNGLVKHDAIIPNREGRDWFFSVADTTPAYSLD